MNKFKVEIIIEAENIDEVLSNITSALEYEGIEYSDIRVVEEGA